MNLTIELSEEDSRAFEAEARAAGLSVAEWLRRVGRERTHPTSGEPRPDSVRPTSDVIAEIMSDTPAEELAKLPKDGASQVDHYVYGHPKR